MRCVYCSFPRFSLSFRVLKTASEDFILLDTSLYRYNKKDVILVEAKDETAELNLVQNSDFTVPIMTQCQTLHKNFSLHYFI